MPTDIIQLINDGGPLALLLVALYFIKGYIEKSTDRTAAMAEEKIDRLLDMADKQLSQSQEIQKEHVAAYSALAERAVGFMTKICERMEADRKAVEVEHSRLEDQHKNIADNQRIMMGAFESELGKRSGQSRVDS